MKRFKFVVAVFFVIYALVMLWLLLIRHRTGFVADGTPYVEQLNSMPYPFQTIVQFVRILVTGDPPYLIPLAWRNLVGNTVLFIPLGVCLPFLFKRCSTAKRTFVTGLLIIAVVELTQFFTLLGSLDFDDFMLNTASIMLGYWIFTRIWGKFGD